MNNAQMILLQLGGNAASMAFGMKFHRDGPLPTAEEAAEMVALSALPPQKKVRKIQYGETLRSEFARLRTVARKAAGKAPLRAC